jgi:GNAT superfamily N-acetyltransferase
MQIRNIETEEFEKFVALADHPEEFTSQLAHLWETGYSFPDYCFVVEENQQFLAGVVYWIQPLIPKEIMLLDFFHDWQSSSSDSVVLLLKTTIQHFKKTGARSVECRLFSDSSHHIYEKKSLLEKVHLTLILEKINYQLSEKIPQDSHVLQWRNSGELTREQIITLLGRVSTPTLDRYEIYNLERFGGADHALDLYNALTDIDPSDDCWQIAYTEADGDLGIVVPQIIEGHTALINYLGVVPELRGNGYGYHLMTHALSQLKNQGFNQFLMDSDTGNLPILHILAKCGFTANYHIWIYKQRFI